MFENNGNDTAIWDGFDNNGNLEGSALFLNASPTQQSFYLSLEDSVNYGHFTVTDDAELDFLDEDFGLSMWFYPVKSFDNPQHLIMKGDRSGSIKENNYSVRINNEFIEFIVHAESGANKVARSSYKVIQNQWNFIAVFYDFVNSKLYFWNDEAAAAIDSFTFSAPLFPNNDKLYIGSSGENGYKRFWGRIDDVRIGNKESDILDISTNIEELKSNLLPFKFLLNQNYPNPFNPETVVKFSLSEKNFTKLDVYNLLGEHISSLINQELPAGDYSARFNGGNLPSGIYFYRLQQGNHSDLKKMILLK